MGLARHIAPRPGCNFKFADTIFLRRAPVNARETVGLEAVAYPSAMSHNRPVAPSPWQQRIRRAEHLAAEQPFAAEILGFYIHTARFQEGLNQAAERSSDDGSVGVPQSARRPPPPPHQQPRLTTPW